MKKTFLLLVVFLAIAKMTFGQIWDVPNTKPDGDPFGAINYYIAGDTTATGERAHPDRIYRLQKDKVYFLNGALYCNFDLKLIADEAVGSEKPPIVASTADAAGVIQLIQFKLFGDGYVKNIIFQMTPPTGSGDSNASFFLSGEGHNYEFDNVMIEWGLWTGIVTEVPVNKVVIKNCYFKNPEHRTNIYNGRGFGFYQENPADSVIMQNNTFFNMNSFAFFADVSSISPNYFLFDHNTIVNSMKFPIHSFWFPDATVTNNLFYNAHSYGENLQDRVGQDPDLQQYGIINLTALPSDLLTYFDIAEGDRKYVVANNGFFYEDDIITYLNEYNLDPTPFMNNRTQGMFDNSAMYPNFSVTNTMVENPDFINPGEGMASMIQWMKNKRNAVMNSQWGWDSDGDKFAVEWPVVENLAYNNETLKTGAEGGFPVGDLNWWPEKKAEWLATMVATNEVQSKIGAITVEPNPAKTHLTIDYTLTEKSEVTISIYNLAGAQISTLYKGTQTGGDHSIN
ncbi:MAG TPA: hypothetical protein ENJ53_08475, partial [Phaeodactylibacter sp.]|nr:hypothetical protein [Phaeodactylibacter sp.]